MPSNRLEVYLTAKTRDFNDALGRSSRAVDDLVGNIQAKAQGAAIAFGALAAGGVALTKSLVDAAAGFESAMRNVNSVTGLTEEKFQVLRQSVLSMSQELKTSSGPKELAGALYGIQQAGFSGADGLQVLRTAAAAAVAGQTDLDKAARVITSTLNAYGASAIDAAKYSDVLYQAILDGETNFDALAQSLGQVTSIAKNAGVPIEDVGAAIATLTAKWSPTELFSGNCALAGRFFRTDLVQTLVRFLRGSASLWPVNPRFLLT